MRSHLLEGVVRHRRVRPFAYALEHRVFYVALDIDELDEVPRRLRSISRGRWNLLSFRDEDHFDPPASDVRATILDHLRGEGVDPDGWQVTLVTNLRVLGYVFNPASFFLCRDRGGELQAVIVEVHNTHGERHLYSLRGEADAPGFVDSMDKAFYVSPFIEMDGRYTVRVRDEASRLRITDQRGSGRRAVAAHEPGPGPSPADRSDGPADARPLSVRDPQDHRDDPLACPAALAARRAFPSTQ